MLPARTTSLLLLALALTLAGCAKPATTSDTPATTRDVTNPTPDAGAKNARLPALPLTLRLDAPTWIEPGTPVPATASGASGALAYTWAVGQLPGTVALTGKPLNTTLISPGETATLTFTEAGLYNMHCHPHPFMRSNVTVIDGYQGPGTVEVQIQDGGTTGEYRFVPENIVVAPGTKVVYRNVGTLPHTATELGRTPPLSKLALDAASGTLQLPTSVPMPGMDMEMAPEWANVVVVAKDASGRVGIANASIYINTFPTPYNTRMTGNFPASGLPESAVPSQTKSFLLDEAGQLYLNFSAKDAASAANPALPNTAAIDIHVKANGATQDLLTSTGKASGALSVRIPPGSYTITLTPSGGANVDYNLYVTVLYDHVPPTPVLSASGEEHKH